MKHRLDSAESQHSICLSNFSSVKRFRDLGCRSSEKFDLSCQSNAKGSQDLFWILSTFKIGSCNGEPNRSILLLTIIVWHNVTITIHCAHARASEPPSSCKLSVFEVEVIRHLRHSEDALDRSRQRGSQEGQPRQRGGGELHFFFWRLVSRNSQFDDFFKATFSSKTGYCTGDNYKEPRPIDVFVLNTKTYRWKALKKPPTGSREAEEWPFQRYGHTVVAHGRKIYLFGGRNDRFPCNRLFCFDTETQNWSCPRLYGTIPSPR